MTMNGATAEVLKLDAVLDLGAAEGFLKTMQQRAQAAPATCIDASAVEALTLPCIQIILAAAKSGHQIAVVDPSEAFSSAFADLALEYPRADLLPGDRILPLDKIPSFPVDPAIVLPEAEALSISPDSAPLPPETPSAHSEDSPMAKRILTIDDSKTIRDMLRMTLVSAGFEVIQAVDGQDGVEVMDREKVDLVITDINMPRMNGYEVVRHLRGNPSHKSLPILVLTTESDSDKKNLAREAGATGWMVKPFDPDRLLETVRKVIPQG
jgi:two-component system chemotaxis response regulator CheY